MDWYPGKFETCPPRWNSSFLAFDELRALDGRLQQLPRAACRQLEAPTAHRTQRLAFCSVHHCTSLCGARVRD